MDIAWHLVLPVTALAIQSIAGFSRYLRATMLDVMRQDYVRTARAKGAGGRRVVGRHALRNALIPLITLIGLSIPALIAGAVITEAIFSYPGLGQLTINAIGAERLPDDLRDRHAGRDLRDPGQPDRGHPLRRGRSAHQVLRGSGMQRADVRTGTLVGIPDQEVDEVDLVPVRTYWQLVRQRFLRHRLAVIALVMLAIIIVVAIDRAARDGRRVPEALEPPAHQRRPVALGALGYNEIGQNKFLRLMPRRRRRRSIIGFAAGHPHRRHRRPRRRRWRATSAAGSTTC